MDLSSPITAALVCLLGACMLLLYARVRQGRPFFLRGLSMNLLVAGPLAIFLAIDLSVELEQGWTEDARTAVFSLVMLLLQGIVTSNQVLFFNCERGQAMALLAQAVGRCGIRYEVEGEKLILQPSGIDLSPTGGKRTLSPSIFIRLWLPRRGAILQALDDIMQRAPPCALAWHHGLYFLLGGLGILAFGLSLPFWGSGAP